MKLQQVSENCFAVLNEKNRVCDANSGLINLGGGVVIDTQSDLPHGRRMIELFGRVWRAMPRRVINTHEDGDHVWGNQLFEGAEIIAHRKVRELMPQVADPKETQQLLKGADRFLTRMLLRALHPGALAVAEQLRQDYSFDAIRLAPSKTVFEDRHVLDLDASKKIDFGPYGGWRAPARLYMNVERAYRELRHEAADAAWDHAKVFDAVLAVAKAIPDCAGLDHDDFVDPGAEIEIRFERLGTLRCRFAEPARRLLPSPWPLRPALQKLHGQ